MRQIQYQAKVEIGGVTPLLQHKCDGLEKNINSPETNYGEEWKKGTYLNPGGINVIPAICLEASFRDGNKGRRLGKHYLTKIIPSGCQIAEFEIPILMDGKKITLERIEKNNWIYSCPVVIQGSRVMRTRTAIPAGWTAIFTLDVINPLLKPEIMQECIEVAGYSAGLLEWRPGAKKSGKFGQYNTNSFEIVN